MTIKREQDHDLEAEITFSDPDETPPVVPAAWPGECAGCGAAYCDGDMIYNTGSGWTAVECCGSEVGL